MLRFLARDLDFCRRGAISHLVSLPFALTSAFPLVSSLRLSPSHSTSPRMPTPRSSYFTTTPYTCRMIKLVYAERVTFSHVYRSVHHGCYDPRRQLRSVTGSVERSPEPLPLREAAGSRQTHRALIGPLHHARTNSNKRYNDIYLYVNNDIYLHHAFKAVWVSGCHTGLIPMMR